MKRYLRELVLLVAVFGGLPFDVASDTAYATPTHPPLRLTGGIQVGTQDTSVYVTGYGAKGDGTTDDTAAIQAAINAAAAASNHGTAYLPTGNYKIGSSAGIVLKSGVSLVGAGSQTTTLTCAVAAVNCISIAAGPVTGLQIRGLKLVGDYTNAISGGVKQRGILAMAIDNSDPAGAGLWNTDITDVEIDNFTGEGIWFRGYLNDFLHPIQFITLRNVQVNAEPSSTRGTSCYVTPEYFDPTHANGTGPCYMIRMTGQVDQISFIGGQVNGPSGVKNGTNIYAGYEVANTETATPSVINFGNGWTCQQADTGAYLNWALDVHFDKFWMESLNRSIKISNARVISVTAGHFASATSDGASGGYAVLADQANSYVVAERNQISGTVDADFTGTNGATVITHDNHNNTAGGAKPSGNTIQVGPSGTLTSYGYKTLLVNGGSSITTINSQLGVGETITIYSFGVGGVTLNSGGNISFGTLTAPLTIAQNGVVTLTRFDLGATWTITSKIP